MKISGADGHGRPGADICDKFNAEGREMPTPLMAGGKGRSNMQRLSRLERAIRLDALETSDPASALLWDRITRARVRGPVAQPDRATVS